VRLWSVAVGVLGVSSLAAQAPIDTLLGFRSGHLVSRWVITSIHISTVKLVRDDDTVSSWRCVSSARRCLIEHTAHSLKAPRDTASANRASHLATCCSARASVIKAAADAEVRRGDCPPPCRRGGKRGDRRCEEGCCIEEPPLLTALLQAAPRHGATRGRGGTSAENVRTRARAWLHAACCRCGGAAAAGGGRIVSHHALCPGGRSE
jgi:hypothetical protein